MIVKQNENAIIGHTGVGGGGWGKGIIREFGMDMYTLSNTVILNG